MLKIFIRSHGGKRVNSQFVLAEAPIEPQTLASFAQKVCDTAAEYFGEGQTEIAVLRRRDDSTFDKIFPFLMCAGMVLDAVLVYTLAKRLARRAVAKEQQECTYCDMCSE